MCVQLQLARNISNGNHLYTYTITTWLGREESRMSVAELNSKEGKQETGREELQYSKLGICL